MDRRSGTDVRRSTATSTTPPGTPRRSPRPWHNLLAQLGPFFAMALTAGSRLGAYEIQSTLGAGGMGVVYRARDTKLNRDVALKVLPDVFAQDPDRLERFKREAHLLAALNHPHVGAIHGLEDGGASPALVLELVGATTSRGTASAFCLMVQTLEPPPQPPTNLVLVSNWLDELRRRVPVP